MSLFQFKLSSHLSSKIEAIQDILQLQSRSEAVRRAIDAYEFLLRLVHKEGYTASLKRNDHDSIALPELFKPETKHE